MSTLKDNLQVQSQGLLLSIQELLLRLKTWFTNLPSWIRILIIILFVLATLGAIALRIGTEQYLTLKYKPQTLLAHSSFAQSENLKVEEVRVLSTGENRYAAYAIISNPNLDLSAEQIGYEFSFFDSNNQLIQSSRGQTYITPNEKKWIVEPRVNIAGSISRAEFSFEEINWQKKLNIPEVELRMAQPFVSQQAEPLALVTQGTVVNNSPYAINQIRLVVVLYDTNGKVMAITQRDEFTLKPYERRAYVLQWPGIIEASVERIELQAYTNSLDPNNLTVECRANVFEDRTRNE